MSDENQWSQPAAPPPPMFVGKPERDLVKQINDEVLERVVGQQVLYYAIDRKNTNYHPLYGEAIEKNFFNPIRVFALVEFLEETTSAEDQKGPDVQRRITAAFHKRRLNEDQDLEITIGDFVKYGDYYYEITKLDTTRKLFGQIDFTFEVLATCVRAREGLFDAS